MCVWGTCVYLPFCFHFAIIGVMYGKTDKIDPRTMSKGEKINALGDLRYFPRLILADYNENNTNLQSNFQYVENIFKSKKYFCSLTVKTFYMQSHYLPDAMIRQVFAKILSEKYKPCTMTGNYQPGLPIVITIY